jgi:hypothetical protein
MSSHDVAVASKRILARNACTQVHELDLAALSTGTVTTTSRLQPCIKVLDFKLLVPIHR